MLMPQTQVPGPVKSRVSPWEAYICAVRGWAGNQHTLPRLHCRCVATPATREVQDVGTQVLEVGRIMV